MRDEILRQRAGLLEDSGPTPHWCCFVSIGILVEGDRIVTGRAGGVKASSKRFGLSTAVLKGHNSWGSRTIDASETAVMWRAGDERK
jgi:hypothetical protein